MDEPIRKSQFLERIRHSRTAWEAALAPLDAAQWTQARPPGQWSVKDMVAHITWHEREMINVLQARALVGSALWELPLDPRNQIIFEDNQNRPLAEVQSEAQAVFQSLWQWLETLSEEELHDPGRFPGMPPDWKPWELLASNTYEHYDAHRAQLQNAP